MGKKPSVTGKKSFVLYLDFSDTLDHLTDKQAGIVFKAIYIWQQTGQLPPLDLAMKLVLAPLVAQFKRDNAKWQGIRVIRSKAGKKGAKQKLANAGKRKQSLANLAVSVSDSVNVSVSDSVNDKNIYSEGFLDFWNAYPRKVGKGAAFKAYQAIKAKPPEAVLLNAVARQAQSPKWHEESGRYIPHPQTWLNQRRWEDEETSTQFDWDKI